MTLFNLQIIDNANPIAVLGPGNALIVEHNTANNAINGYFLWRERPLEGKFDIR